MLPDVINGQAHCLYVRYAKKCFNLIEGFLQAYIFLKYNSSCIE